MGYAERNNPNSTINVSEAVRKFRYAKREAEARQEFKEAMSNTAVPVMLGAAAGFMAAMVGVFNSRVSKYAGGWGRKPQMRQKVIG